MKLFHGTSADALPSILKNGLLIDKGGENWTVSGEAVYFWSPDSLVERGESDDLESAEYMARGRAFESAQMALGFAKDCRAIVIEVELDSAEIVNDESCEGMAGAVCSFDDVPRAAIKSIRVSDDLSLLKGVFLSYMLDRDMSARQLSPLEEKIAKAMQKAEIYCETIEDIAGSQEDWEEIV